MQDMAHLSFVFKYRTFSVGAISAAPLGDSEPVTPAHQLTRLCHDRMDVSPSRVWAPMPCPGDQANPNSTLASTVSLPCSCNSYARSLLSGLYPGLLRHIEEHLLSINSRPLPADRRSRSVGMEHVPGGLGVYTHGVLLACPSRPSAVPHRRLSPVGHELPHRVGMCTAATWRTASCAFCTG